MNLRKCFRVAIAKAGTNQAELAKIMGVSRQHVSSQVNGHKVISLPKLAHYCQIFGITMSQFFAYGEENVSRETSAYGFFLTSKRHVTDKTQLYGLNALEDASNKLYQKISKNREHLGKWLDWVRDVNSVMDSEVFLDQAIASTHNQKNLVFFIMHNNALVGMIGLDTINHHTRSANLGYWLAEDKQGHGIVTECCYSIINHGFEDLNLKKITARVTVGNYASDNVLETLGFHLEGLLRKNDIVNGEFVDQSAYGLCKNDFVSSLMKKPF